MDKKEFTIESLKSIYDLDDDEVRVLIYLMNRIPDLDDFNHNEKITFVSGYLGCLVDNGSIELQISLRMLECMIKYLNFIKSDEIKANLNPSMN